MNNKIEIEQICDIARAAGKAILDIYDTGFDVDRDVEIKGDGSPLTIADQAADKLIGEALSALTPDIPVLSEETFHQVGDTRLAWPTYWLVDPLDGTKEFVKRNGEFTVNIALIEKGKPIVGVVYAPVLKTLYFGVADGVAFKQLDGEAVQRIQTRKLNFDQVDIVASRSHLSDEVKQFADSFNAQAKSIELISMGSSLKLCLVAEGKADFYPRLGLTSEWDTAAAQCVVEAAGGVVVDCDAMPLKYTKADILNPWFLVVADPTVVCDCEGLIPV